MQTDLEPDCREDFNHEWRFIPETSVEVSKNQYAIKEDVCHSCGCSRIVSLGKAMYEPKKYWPQIRDRLIKHDLDRLRKLTYTCYSRSLPRSESKIDRLARNLLPSSESASRVAKAKTTRCLAEDILQRVKTAQDCKKARLEFNRQLQYSTVKDCWTPFYIRLRSLEEILKF